MKDRPQMLLLNDVYFLGREGDFFSELAMARLYIRQFHAPVQTQIDLSRYANGVYFIKAVADGNVIGVRKVVKQ